MSKGFLCKLKEVMKEYQPSIIVLLEPRISEAMADEVCKKIGKKMWIRSEARGFSGGILVMWDEKEIKLKFIYDDCFFLHLSVKSAGCLLWNFMAIYASPNPSIRRHLWEKLDGMECARLGY